MPNIIISALIALFVQAVNITATLIISKKIARDVARMVVANHSEEMRSLITRSTK